jgi:FemAB-related protein (PEP-CTERM system-associated)
MAVHCRTLDAASTAAWDAFVLGWPAGTFCHRAAWAAVLQSAFGHRPHYFLATQDGSVTGVLPLMEVKSFLFGHRLISTPFCVYGGPLAADRESFDALVAAAIQAQASTGADVLELRFRDPPPPEWLDPQTWPERADLYATFRKPISASDDDNLKAIPRKQRAVVRKALAADLCATVSRDTDGLHRIYAESVRNLGTPVFPRRYFRLLAEAFGADMDVLSIAAGAQVQAAVMNFHFRDEVLPYYGGGLRDARSTGANDLMYWEVMRQAAARGARLFDFGRSKTGTGAYAFKKNWGFAASPLVHRFHLRPGATLPDHSPSNPKYRLMIDTWKRLPLPLANALGPLIVRGTG